MHELDHALHAFHFSCQHVPPPPYPGPPHPTPPHPTPCRKWQAAQERYAAVGSTGMSQYSMDDEDPSEEAALQYYQACGPGIALQVRLPLIAAPFWWGASLFLALFSQVGRVELALSWP
jgi:hypothetical protein